MIIRTSGDNEIAEIAAVHTAAFGEKHGPEVAELTLGLFKDPTALPLLSLVAEEEGRITGHILFTHVTIHPDDESGETGVGSILAPLAVLPKVHGTGVGTALIREGLTRLKAGGVDLVFVLGHPGYYPRCGFAPAGVQGFQAPYPIPEKDAGAWMVQSLGGNMAGAVKGRVQCAGVMDRPEHWRE